MLLYDLDEIEIGTRASDQHEHNAESQTIGTSEFERLPTRHSQRWLQ